MKLLKLKEIADVLSTSRSTVRKLIDEGKIDATKVGSQRRATPEAVERYLRGNSNLGYQAEGKEGV